MKTAEQKIKLPENITIQQAKRIYQKSLSEGVVFGMNTEYKIMEFEQIVAEVLKENEK